MIYENINKEGEGEGKWEEARKVLDNFRVEFTAAAAAFSYLHYNSSLSLYSLKKREERGSPRFLTVAYRG